MNKRGIVIISGATATGKSGLALELAKKIDGEIINADIGSFYTRLTIGTAKPNWKQDSWGNGDKEIKHHLFDILDAPESFTVHEYKKRLHALLLEIWDRGHRPIIVGGSVFYIQSLFFKQYELPDTQKWVNFFEKSAVETDKLWDMLQAIDPIRASAIYRQDRYRIIRALAIFKATGQSPSQFDQQLDLIAPFYFIICSRDRSELYQRINQRVLEMIHSGWVEEVEALRGSGWSDFLYKKKFIGYDDLLVAGQNEIEDEVVANIQKKTRHYAKRQIIFLNKLKKELLVRLESGCVDGGIEDICLTLCDVGLYINGLSERILKIFC